MTTPQAALVEAMPPLPSGNEYIAGSNRHFAKVCGTVTAYTAEQMRAYGEACARAALAQAEAAPKREALYKVTIRGRWHEAEPTAAAFSLPDGEHLLYGTAQPQQPAPLSEEVLLDLYNQHSRYQIEGITLFGWVRYARAVEAAHGVVQP